MSALRAVRSNLARQRTYRPHMHWPIVLAIIAAEFAACMALLQMTQWWISMPVLTLYFGAVPLCWSRGYLRPFWEFMVADRAPYTLFMVLTLGAVVCLGGAFVVMLGMIAFVVGWALTYLAEGAYYLAIAFMSLLMVCAELLVDGINLLLDEGWWLIWPVVIFVLVYSFASLFDP